METINNNIVKIIDYLNKKAGKHFVATCTKSREPVKALLQQGYTVDQLCDVIDKKCDEWLGLEKCEIYLRPVTLFRLDNFLRYLQQDNKSSRNKPKRNYDEE
ncbi:MAG: conserved phage C-terminal domain-containing protein [Clostridia bacterium]